MLEKLRKALASGDSAKTGSSTTQAPTDKDKQKVPVETDAKGAASTSKDPDTAAKLEAANVRGQSGMCGIARL